MSLSAAGADGGWYQDEHKDASKTDSWSEKMNTDDSEHAKMQAEDSKRNVKIDIEPTDETNMVNLSQKGALEAAILGAADFKIDDVDRETVMLKGQENNGNFRVEDVNNDGIKDLIVTFDTDDLSLDEDTKMLTLEGKTLDGKSFEGSDSVNVAATQKPLFE